MMTWLFTVDPMYDNHTGVYEIELLIAGYVSPLYGISLYTI
jgi:hypothetical protein